MSGQSHFARSMKKETLAEQMAAAIEQAILDGAWRPGEALPTEPSLAEQFGVSRAVVRDATRLLLARGLVEVEQGRGVFVTHSQLDAFGRALLLALRRQEATVWDVERFEQLLVPEVVALAAVEASEEDVARIRRAAEEHEIIFTEVITTSWGKVEPLSPAEQERFLGGYRRFMQAVFDATHNRVLQVLAQPLVNLRSLRRWRDDGRTLEEALAQEHAYLQRTVDLIAAGDPHQARMIMAEIMRLPAEAEEAMRWTPVGETPDIPVPLPRI